MTTLDRLGKYEITEVLGRGAMGVVYKGFDPGIRRTVAIKTIRKELIEGDRPAATMLARFRNEARAAGQLSHPGIVAVYDYGEAASVAYIAMEYVEGNSLREYFDRGTRFSEGDAVSIMSQLLDALGHAHARQVWHRDIKPANLIVMMDGRVKVADFGIARIESSDLTHTGAIMGSPGYMAPEQYAAAAIDHRADIFAAGVVFYQLLTGKRPFVGSPEQVAYAICHTEVPRVSLVDVSRNVEQYDAIVAKALAKRPEDRFKTAEAFRAAILEAHAAPAAATISAETIITAVLRPAAAVDLSSPPGPDAVAPQSAVPPARSGPRRSVMAGAGLALAIVAAGATWYGSAHKSAPPAPAPEPVAAAPAAPAATAAPLAPARAQPDELVFWESVRNSTHRAELEAYLARYPDGAFAALARARLDALAAAAAKPAAVAPAPRAAVAPPPPERKAAEKPASVEPRPAAKADASQEALFWESVRATSNPAELKAYLEKYPGGTFETLARARLDAIAAAEAKAAAEPKLNVPPRSGSAQETLRLPAMADTTTKPAAALPSIARRYAGLWKGSISCDALENTGPFTTAVSVALNDDVFVLERGKRDQPGYFILRGTPDPDGRLQLLGTGISGMANYRGKPFNAGFMGKFDGDRYEAPGRLGARQCVVSIARAGT
jgi:tRNA A-37 threonylcarbamoyl transferase component Bud32